jgi:hypothetical protein
MLTQRLESAARAIFGPAEATAVAWLDQHCSAAKLHVAPEMVERIAAAALKVSEGSLERLEAATELAATDWRDLIMAAGFGHDLSAHEVWLRELTQQEVKVR